MTKINPCRIIQDHWGTFGNRDGDGKCNDFVVFYLCPLVAALALAWFCSGIKIGDSCRTNAITVHSIFIPLAFTLMASLYGLQERMRMKKIHRLLEHLYYNSAYCILVSVFCLAGLFVVEVTSQGDTRWFAAVFVGVSLHILLTVLMVIKRFNVIMKESMKPKPADKPEHKS